MIFQVFSTKFFSYQISACCDYFAAIAHFIIPFSYTSDSLPLGLYCLMSIYYANLIDPSGMVKQVDEAIEFLTKYYVSSYSHEYSYMRRNSSLQL